MDIHTYASQGDVEKARNELEKGVPVDVRDKDDITPLAYALMSPNADAGMIRLLIESGADVDAPVSDLGESKRVPIELAACSGRQTLVELLLDAGANIRYRKEHGYAILDSVVRRLHKDEMLVPMCWHAPHFVIQML